MARETQHNLGSKVTIEAVYISYPARNVSLNLRKYMNNLCSRYKLGLVGSSYNVNNETFFLRGEYHPVSSPWARRGVVSDSY